MDFDKIYQKLKILTDAAKYDAACTSSGVTKKGERGMLGSASECGICHSFSADGRCISLLKVLLTNVCVYDCKYCVNRASNDVKRAAFTPEELASLTVGFYRRNYIEGLFLSSAVIKNADHTAELMLKTLTLLRNHYRFNGYIHVKAIPGADPLITERIGYLADRMSVNIELPSEKSLNLLAPDKTRKSIVAPMKQISEGIIQSKSEIVKYRHAPAFVPAGQSTQMIVGATPETDLQIMRLSSALYSDYKMKRVFFSAYIPTVEDSLLPSVDTKPPLLREHRLYQADWLMRFYGFSADELLCESEPNFNPYLDPKCSWALRHPEFFPVEINTAPKEMLLRVPGIGVKSALRIIYARRASSLRLEGLSKLGVVMKRARFFITAGGRYDEAIKISSRSLIESMLSDTALSKISCCAGQLSLFDEPTGEGLMKCITGEM
ncbi:MAG: putative DNA modification/repair radical SAM protein [Clostridia bacterium]|nr:putative DNA modification/repair radical SAM protein [Clostridia bacterium]